MDLDLDINKDFEENSPYGEGIILETYQRPDKSQLLEPPELADLINTNNLVQKYLPKQTDIDKSLKILEKGIKRFTSPCNHKGDTSRIFKQPIFQKYIPIFITKQITKFKECYTQSWTTNRKVCLVRFTTVQTDYNPRKGNCIIDNSRNMCRQDHYTLSFKSFCRISRCNKDILDNNRQILYTRSCALLMFLYKRLPYVSID